ncbi:Na-translocating system protein MpsC family protein [Fredinandcohnia sp. QZ13]|uniref:Na-translocating system protein MpsC family protein n=1 Tax=Fredinandcohnia sp. QZ13 TaxID=3073144 RepID=UPI00285303C1|nr:Na-translocating system protein MpsC family protein [Fredinandcohnia sp. QZ13]MDR4887939.1 Na-translocating system protein MpsC family protein [Fredinandcohnia sp. QZ13]
MSMRNITKQEELTHISSYVSKLIKSKFGKGPETCFTSISDQYIVIHIKKFMTKIEHELVKKEDFATAGEIRTRITEELLDPIQETLGEICDNPITNLYQDWNFQKNSGVLLAVVNSEQQRKVENSLEFMLLRKEISKQSEFYQYQPYEQSLTKIGEKIYIIRTAGYILPIERILIEKGMHILKERENNIRKKYHANRHRFNKIINNEIHDIFMIWDYDKDENYKIFYCK